MEQPTSPAGGGTPSPEPSYEPRDGTTAAASGDAAWTAPPAPSWTTPWSPPGEASASATPAPPAHGTARRGPLVLALVAAAGVLAGAIGGAFLVMAVFVSSAEEIGREIAAEVAPEVAREAGDGVVDALGDLGVSMLDEEGMTEGFGWGPGGPTAPVEQHPAVDPGELGPDPVLNQYAQECFEGNLQSCDDLLHESPPLSDYEEYAITCGGRVKQYAVVACTDLE